MAYDKQKIVIKDWAEADRPREKLMKHGRRHLTDAELVAILINSGNKDESAVDLSKRILASCGNDLDALGRLSVKELSTFRGIGEAKAIAIVAALELGRRRKNTEAKAVVQIRSSADSYQQLLPVFSDLTHEEFWILLLNRANHVIGNFQISKGGLSGTVADPKVIFKTALEHNAAAIILSHNHPSGNCKPSADDLSITKKIVAAGKVLDLPVIDHLIVTNKMCFSFTDEGLI
ncbi:DNA repair protein [Pedobacter sp. BAL39]|uniref:RadC family protein n=1 Tax=Pedobacter sp. BAL39 TaxID=391596 RepID=UPI000155B26E|nr:DNA repair protein RadC [Pedobacter sp. BAL39]EDM34054.1 DNA repair protein [Pedobacter sp. BAL39]